MSIDYSEVSPDDGLQKTEAAEEVEIPKERYDLRIMGALRRIIHAVGVYSRKLSQNSGMTVPQLMCMLKVDELGSPTVKELSQEIFLNPSTVVGIVDRLERNGVFTRTRSVKDRRKVRIALTDKGQKMLENSPSPLQDNLAKSIDALPELEKIAIASSLEKLILLMDKSSPEDFEISQMPHEPVLGAFPEFQEDSKGSVDTGPTPKDTSQDL